MSPFHCVATTWRKKYCFKISNLTGAEQEADRLPAGPAPGRSRARPRGECGPRKRCLVIDDEKQRRGARGRNIAQFRLG